MNTTEHNIKKEITIIDVIIKISREIMKLRIVKSHLEKELRLLITVVDSNTEKVKEPIRQAIRELDHQMRDLKLKTSNYIRPFFHSEDFDMTDVFVISTHELYDGYMFLNKVLKRDDKGKILESTIHVLFLQDYKSKNINVKKGDIKPLVEVEQFLNNLRPIVKFPSFYRKRNHMDKKLN